MKPDTRGKTRHDIKNVLAAIKIMVQVLARRTKDKKEVETLLSIDKKLNELNLLVDELR